MKTAHGEVETKRTKSTMYSPGRKAHSLQGLPSQSALTITLCSSSHSEVLFLTVW